ncbi:MAG: hypothetical protein ACD_30C00079G0002 [uncultured bacterium]|uniref:Serine--tRNA ligase n=3 Tax=Candidatus Daviesiibacteriota TaxID=1752718 RepID=A0A1F5K1H2_9BACT|nr:MAG: hypothetical protein ACD_30C00079G0002 [uncultured bacterium]KKQ15404.1 MAG: Serine-tRNA ligase [Candidatus Daviesbacteria bacterium GW2011_GWA1_36_8]OGE16677.1 MAG: serine--tRNA ligase [Candidatus Daviesbacteria bacterium RIFCSPHIGHO2_01_FULL_36_37]OGE31642.1 MAG: serine--tRNA ligase [Candidatus Daviesbacteria bacterium RIFCSPHIGHO2_02_FULL_37_9]OGE34754.1 MAG: serine--tRNA ligase [Candidatus Daviesbacteria bacterium RIFCSPHIGHO2_12_FULL_37_16]
MLDINFIRENTDLVKKAVLDKEIKLDVNELLKLDDRRRELLGKVEDLRAQRNQAAKERNIELGKKVKGELDGLEDELRKVEEKFRELMLLAPNIPAPDAPVGKDAQNNEVIYKWGNKPDFDFEVKDHIELGKNLDILDLEQGAKVSGFRGYYLKNEGAVLHWAILRLAMDRILSHGFSLMVPPTLVHEEVLEGSGHFPFGKENIYQIANPGKLDSGEDIKKPVFLTGTSEPSLLAYFMGKTLSEEDLPVKVAAMTQCYRSEVGDYGKDTRGLYRIHEFTKVEQVVICSADLDESEKLFKEMQEISQKILEDLGIPYQVIATSTGDMGAGKYRMNDIEAWMPGRNKYGETHSNSNLTDWQARRLNIKVRYKNEDIKYVYTLNNTVIASPRILIAILENFQQKDGSIKIPDILIPYTGFSEISSKH